MPGKSTSLLIPVVVFITAIVTLLVWNQLVGNSQNPLSSTSPITTATSPPSLSSTTPSSTRTSTMIDNIAFYLGTSKYMNIDITSSEWKNIYNKLTQIAQLNESTRIIMFGLTTCPHCHAQQEFFETEIPGKVLYLWIDMDDRAGSLFSQLTNLEISKGAPPQYVLGVPHIIVLDRDGGLVAVVIGEAKDKGFWDRLLST